MNTYRDDPIIARSYSYELLKMRSRGVLCCVVCEFCESTVSDEFSDTVRNKKRPNPCFIAGWYILCTVVRVKKVLIHIMSDFACVCFIQL